MPIEKRFYRGDFHWKFRVYGSVVIVVELFHSHEILRSLNTGSVGNEQIVLHVMNLRSTCSVGTASRDVFNNKLFTRYTVSENRRNISASCPSASRKHARDSGLQQHAKYVIAALADFG